MKIIKYDEFIRMPKGTVFCEYEPCVFHYPFHIKTDEGEERNGVYMFNGTMPLEPWFLSEEEYPLDVCVCETEMAIWDNSSVDFDQNKFFAILEKEEIERLINALKWALTGCEEILKDGTMR